MDLIRPSIPYLGLSLTVTDTFDPTLKRLIMAPAMTVTTNLSVAAIQDSTASQIRVAYSAVGSWHTSTITSWSWLTPQA